jgi:hypothetical protein
VSREAPADEPQTPEDRVGRLFITIGTAIVFSVVVIGCVAVILFLILWGFGVITPFPSGACT